MIRKFFIFSFYIFLNSHLFSQCPERAALWNRIIYLRDSSNISYPDQLKELNIYLSKIKDCTPFNDSVNALLLQRMGVLVSHNRDFKTAIILTIRSIQMIQSHKGEVAINESHLIKSYHNLQIFYDSTGQEKLKNRAADSCIAISLRLKTGYPFSVEHISSKIEDYFGKGDYVHSLELASIGENISRTSGFRFEDAFYYISWEINSLIFLNRLTEASEKITRSIAEYLPSGNKKYLGNLLSLKATIAAKNGQSGQAIEDALRSVYYEKLIGNYPDCAGTLNNLGFELYYKKLKQYDKAFHYYKEALKYASTGDSLYILNNIANVFVQKGEFATAFLYFQEAFSKIFPTADEKFFLSGTVNNFPKTWNAEYVLNLVLDKAEALVKRYVQTNHYEYILTALNIYKSADQLMDKIKISQSDLSSKLFWRTDMRRLYERAINVCFILGNQEDGYYFFEKSRAVLLNDQLKEQETGDPTLQEIAAVKKNVILLEKQLAALDSLSQEYSALQREIFVLNEQLGRLDQLVKEKNPWYYQSLIDTNFISLEEVQSRLLGHEKAAALLEFFSGDSAIYLFSVTAGKSGITRINKMIFENSVDKYNSYLSDPDLENRDFEGFVRSARQLYHLIFDSLHLPDGRVIISPDGKYFPFESLVTNTNISSPAYFLTDHAVSYTYSARFLLNEFSKNRASNAGNFLGIAPVHFPTAFHLPSLSRSDVSLEKISSYFGNSKNLVASQASRNNFMQQFQVNKIIQLYTHASDSSNHGEPVIYFADSTLYLSELITENKTAAQLIVLSACETGNGKFYKGEGVFSFNRGFAALGIPSSVINLWSVDNESTYKLTELFYKYVSAGIPLDISLQKAKLEFISSSTKGKKLPYYWAAAIIAGKTDAIEMNKEFHGKWLALIGDFFLMFLAFFVIRKMMVHK